MSKLMALAIRRRAKAIRIFPLVGEEPETGKQRGEKIGNGRRPASEPFQKPCNSDFPCGLVVEYGPVPGSSYVTNYIPTPANPGNLSFLIAVFAIVMAAFSTGIGSKSFQFRKDQVQSDDDIPYGYGFFHFVFSMGAMYFAMLFVGWNLHQSMEKWSIDVGWASTWVKIVNEWLAASLYSKNSFILLNASIPGTFSLFLVEKS
eukprot:Gb_12917 [translate_table: standard]